MRLIIERPTETGFLYYYETIRVRTLSGFERKIIHLKYKYKNYFDYKWHRPKIYLDSKILRRMIKDDDRSEIYKYDVDYLIENANILEVLEDIQRVKLTG